MPNLEASTHLYGIWRRMRQRCYNPKYKDYPLYGGIGIKVFEEWNLFTFFKDWAKDNGYGDSYEDQVLVRLDLTKDFTPDNCMWVTEKESTKYFVSRKNRTERVSRFKGVYWNKRRQIWVVQVTIKKKLQYVGSFSEEVIAAKAYDEYVIDYFGCDAKLNFPVNPKIVESEVSSLSTRKLRDSENSWDTPDSPSSSSTRNKLNPLL